MVVFVCKEQIIHAVNPQLQAQLAGAEEVQRSLEAERPSQQKVLYFKKSQLKYIIKEEINKHQNSLRKIF
jgi:hypothetical protein